MRKDEWNDAIEHIDEQIFEEVIDEKMKYRSKRRRTKILRAAALATALAVLAAAVPVTALALRTPEQPGDLPAVAQTEEKKTNEETKEKTTADEPTDIDKTTENKATEAETTTAETTTEETTTEETTDTVEPPETTEPVETPSEAAPTDPTTEVSTPTANDKIGRLYYYGSNADGEHDYWFNVVDLPFLAVRVIGITDNHISQKVHVWKDSTYTERIYKDFFCTEIEYEVLCSCGLIYNHEIGKMVDLSEVMKDHPRYYVSDSCLNNVQLGDIIICYVFPNNIINGVYDYIHTSFGPSDFRIEKIEDGRLAEWGFEHFFVYSKALNDLRIKIKNGFEVVNKELFERMPDVEIQLGVTTAEELVEVMQWFEELRKVAVINVQNGGTVFAVYEVIV